MHDQQNYYHGHLPVKFTIKDIYANTVLVERIEAGKILEGGVLLNERPVERIFIENDGTIVLMTNPLEYGSSRLIKSTSMALNFGKSCTTRHGPVKILIQSTLEHWKLNLFTFAKSARMEIERCPLPIIQEE